jgi:ribonucleoside-diphosphate reductase beta chain
MYGLAAQNEKNWTKYLFSRGALLGLNENTLNGYVEWLANNRLTSNGFDKIFSTTQNPIGNWLTSYTDSSKVQNAPQETEITAYKIGSRDVSGSASEISDIEL